MADSDDQRQRREFVPPPWERDQFEELARRKAEQDLDRLVEAVGQPNRALHENPVADAVPAASPAAGTTPAGGELQLSDAELQVMFYSLKAEEPDAVRDVALASLVVGGLLAVGGALILGYGLFALSRSMNAGAGAAVGAATVMGVGGLLVAAGAWLATKGLRQRGER